MYLFFVLNVNVKENNYVVPLEVRLDSNFISIDDIPRTVQVTVRGSPAALNKIVEQNMNASIDFTTVKEEGTTTAQISLQRSGVFAQINNVEITVSPNQITTQLEQKIFKDVSVRSAFINSLPRGYTLENSRVSPSTVRIFGPRTLLNDITEITTNDIDLSNITSNIARNIQLKSPNALVEFEEVTSVNVRISVQQSVVERTFNTVTVVPENLSSQLQVSADIASPTVTVQGALLLLDTYTPMVFVDLEQYVLPGLYDMEANIVAVEGVTVVSLNPPRVEVSLSRIVAQPEPPVVPNIIPSAQ